MLETFAHAELRFLSDEGSRVWSYAHMNIDIPWFFVRYEVEEAGVILTSQYLLFDDKQVEQLTKVRSITIHDIYLVSPDYINKSPSWSMDIIKSLVTGYDELGDQTHTVSRYELKDSTFYFYPSISDEAQFKKTADIYIANRS